MKPKVVGYWVTTALLVFALVAGGTVDLAHLPVTDVGMNHLGYPLYFTDSRLPETLSPTSTW